MSFRVQGLGPSQFKNVIGLPDAELSKLEAKRYAVDSKPCLLDRFPKTTLIGADPAFEEIVAKVVGLVEQPRFGLDLPTDVRGTAFQQRVWKALRELPAGSAASYAEIARAVGAPRAVRAVAQACGANPLVIAIPCHRVVRNDGSLPVYRWSVERKRALLELEAEQAA